MASTKHLLILLGAETVLCALSAVAFAVVNFVPDYREVCDQVWVSCCQDVAFACVSVYSDTYAPAVWLNSILMGLLALAMVVTLVQLCVVQRRKQTGGQPPQATCVAQSRPVAAVANGQAATSAAPQPGAVPSTVCQSAGPTFQQIATAPAFQYGATAPNFQYGATAAAFHPGINPALQPGCISINPALQPGCINPAFQPVATAPSLQPGCINPAFQTGEVPQATPQPSIN